MKRPLSVPDSNELRDPHHLGRRAESEPTLPAQELALIYTRAGDLGSDSDLWIAGRIAVDLPFGVDNPDHESSPHPSRDGCELFFARACVQDPSAWDIYRSEIQ